MPPLSLCTDNAVMGAIAIERFRAGLFEDLYARHWSGPGAGRKSIKKRPGVVCRAAFDCASPKLLNNQGPSDNLHPAVTTDCSRPKPASDQPTAPRNCRGSPSVRIPLAIWAVRAAAAALGSACRSSARPS